MHNEEIYTPMAVSSLLLGFLTYSGSVASRPNKYLSKKHIMDNSCGNGMLLGSVVSYYIQEARSLKKPDKEIVKELETYIHGIEINENLCNQVASTLDTVVTMNMGANKKIKWDIKCADAILCNDYDGKMDIVIGNPPYCRVHDFDSRYPLYKGCQFMEKGMSDLYIAFFGVGLRMLKEGGELVYITPQSWLWSIAGRSLREYLVGQRWDMTVVEQGHIQHFPSVTTFTAITHIKKGVPSESYRHIMKPDGKFFGIEIPYSDALIGGRMWYAEGEERKRLKDIMTAPSGKYTRVQNGFATLNDKLFRNTLELSRNNIRVVKGGTLGDEIFFYPYDESGKPLSWDEIDEMVRVGLVANADRLNVDVTKKGWFLYGRTQALRDVSKPKIVVSQYVHMDRPYKYRTVPANTGVYSGYYIVCEEGATQEEITKILDSKAFKLFVKTVGRCKNGDYYTVTSSELEKFLNYELDKIKNANGREKC